MGRIGAEELYSTEQELQMEASGTSWMRVAALVILIMEETKRQLRTVEPFQEEIEQKFSVLSKHKVLKF